MVLLHKIERQTCACKYVAPVGFRKETARVVDPRGCNKFDGGNGGGTNLYVHDLTYLCKSCTYTSFNQVVAVYAAHEADFCIGVDKVGKLYPAPISGGPKCRPRCWRLAIAAPPGCSAQLSLDDRWAETR